MDDEEGAASDSSGQGGSRPFLPPESRKRVRIFLVLLGLLLIANGIWRAVHSDGKDSGPPAKPSSSAAPTSSTSAQPSPSPVASSAAANPRPALSSPADVSAGVVASRTRAITALLKAQASAFLHRDRARFAATIDPGAVDFQAHQLRVFDNAAKVPFASWYYDVDSSDVAAATSPAAGRLVVPVTLHYALRGFDPRPTALRDYLTFVHRGDSWRLATDTATVDGKHSARDLWDFGPVVVVRGAHTLVLAHPGRSATAHTLAATADAAVPRVTAFWGRAWARSVVVLIPNNLAELRAIAGTNQDLSRIAALATAEIGGSSGAVGNRVAINPTTFATLGALGRRVVITHEITHVATRSVTGANSPTWLVEGIADYVGFKGTSTSLRFDAAELSSRVDAGQLPTALPTSADFAHAGALLPLEYEQSWMACKFIVSRTSEAALIAFYRSIGTSTGTPDQAVKAAFRQVLHTDQATFTRSWISYVGASLK